jgi:hypothetical protein
MMTKDISLVSIYPKPMTARALGVSLKKDFLVLALVTNEFVVNVEFFAHRSSPAIRDVPAALHDEFNWTSDPFNRANAQVDPNAPKLPEYVFPAGRVIGDACAKVETVGYASLEQTNILGDRTVNVTQEQIDVSLFKLKLRENTFLAQMERGDEGMKIRARIVRHFYDNPKSRQDAIVAICRAYAAQETLKKS